MNIAIYARVSSDSQAKEGTIHSQIEALQEYAQANNLTILYKCIDDGFSGTNLNRPGLDQLRDLTQEGLIDGILVLSPDRLSRKSVQQLLLLEEFKKRNIQVIFTNQQFGDTPEDNLMLQIQGAISEYERTKILDRTRRGIKHAAKKGQVIGSNTPYGYSFVHKTATTPAHWEVDPREAEIVRLVFDLYVNKGLTAGKIVSYLEYEGIPSRSSYSKWWKSAIYSILKNEAYLGTAYMFKTKCVEPKKSPKVMKYRKRKNSSKADRPKEDWIGIPVTPLIEPKTWDAAQELLKINARKSPRNNTRNKYLLRGLVVCGLCGSMASGYVSNKKPYYSCVAKRNKNITTIPHDERIIVKQPTFDDKVWSGLVELLSNPEEIKAQTEKRLDRKTGITTRINPDVDNTNKDLEKLSIQEQRILDAYREGIITLDELKSQKETIAKKRRVLESKIKATRSLSEGLGRTEITMDMLGDVSARFERAMKKASFDKRQKLANLLINSVTLFPEKAIVAGNIPVIQSDVLSTSNPRSHPQIRVSTTEIPKVPE
jgi:site-specific DNA recombinase